MHGILNNPKENMQSKAIIKDHLCVDILVTACAKRYTLYRAKRCTCKTVMVSGESIFNAQKIVHVQNGL